VLRISLEPMLKDLGAVRVKTVKQRECEVVVVEFKDDIFLISLSRGGMTDNYVAKVVPSTKVYSWGCIDIEYSPYGLYVVAGDEEELAKKIINKLNILRSRTSGRT